MQNILIPFDGSDSALHAVRYAASIAHKNRAVALHLLHVQDPAAAVLHVSSPDHRPSPAQVEAANQVLQTARESLDRADIPYKVHVRVGSAAEEIAAQVTAAGCDAVIMGTRGMGPVANLVIGSTATRVVHLVDVPVTLIK